MTQRKWGCPSAGLSTGWLRRPVNIGGDEQKAEREREREKERATLMASSQQDGAWQTALGTHAVVVGVNGGGGHSLLPRDLNAGARAKLGQKGGLKMQKAGAVEAFDLL